MSLGEQAALARIEESLFGQGPGPVLVGRYHVEHALGSGAFGRVYRAFDPQLNRRVALKVLSGTASEAAPSATPGPGTSVTHVRLLREAKVMATVSHPNVAAVYDAGIVGEGHDARVFIVMELVDGLTLAQWSAKTTPPFAEVLRVLIEAGRGLAAAHSAGVIHRDFKPENILVGADGRVRVVDFGLAHGPDERPDSMTPEAAGASPLEVTRTAKGMLVGTPAYMAPEQHEGEPADPASDQFAYCVTCWETAFGERPHPGQTVAEVADAIRSGTVASAKGPLTAAQRRLTQVLSRGLKVTPTQRYPSMAQLLSALEAAAGAPRRGVLGLVAVAVTLLAAVAAVGFSRAGSRVECQTAEQLTASMWGAPRQEKIASAFTAGASKVAGAAAIWSETQQYLDHSVRAWAEASSSACALARHDTTEAVARRTGCLQERGQELGVLLEILERADATVIEHAALASHSLPPVSRCEAADTAEKLPTAPEARAKYDELTEKLARARVEHIAGQSKEALALAATVEADAKAAGFASLEANAAYWSAEALVAAAQSPKGIEAAHRCFDIALAAANERIELRCAGILAFAYAFDPRQLKEALRWVHTAQTLLTRVSGDSFSEARLLNAEGNAYLNNGKPELAEPAFEKVVALLTRNDPDDPNIGSSLAMAGISALYQGKPEKAVARLQDAHARIVKAFGANHPEAASAQVNLALALCGAGNYAAAEASAREGLASQVARLGADAALVAYGQLELSQVLVARGEFAAAALAATEAERIASLNYGQQGTLTQQVQLAHAEILARQGRGAESVALTSSVRSALDPADVATQALADATLSLGHRVAGHFDDAVATAQRAVDTKDPEHLAVAQHQLGEALLAKKKPAEARVALRAAQKLLREGSPDPARLVEVQLALIRAGDAETLASKAALLEHWPEGAMPKLRTELEGR